VLRLVRVVGERVALRLQLAMAALSCGTDALTLGSLMMFASGVLASLPSSASVSGTRCAGGQALGEGRQDAPAASEMSRVSMATPAGAAKAWRMGSSEKVARAGASSVNV
jgi:hypothetical protein